MRGLATFGPMPVDGKLMDALPKLEIISNFGVGVDAINLDDAKKRNIIVTNTPDVLNECVADTALRSDPEHGAQVPAVGGLPARRQLGVARSLSAHHVARRQDARRARAGPHRRGDRRSAPLACGMKIRYHNRSKKDVPLPVRPGSGHAGEATATC